MTWERADAFAPATYAPLLKGADFVVHSLGIFLELDYKGVVSGKETPLEGLRKAFSTPKSPSLNPLERENRGDAGSGKPPEAETQLTYELINRDSAILLAKEAARENVGAFAYISATAGAPIQSSRYLSSKREAESVIASEFPGMRGVFVRAPFMYDSSRPITVALAGALGLGTAFNGLTGNALSKLVGILGAKPLQADVVGQAVVEALADDSYKGPVEVPEIEELANKAWRKSML